MGSIPKFVSFMQRRQHGRCLHMADVNEQMNGGWLGKWVNGNLNKTLFGMEEIIATVSAHFYIVTVQLTITKRIAI